MAVTSELHISKQIVPYSDGSGYRLRVELERDASGAVVVIHQFDENVAISVENWREVKEVIDHMIEFMSDEAQSLAPVGQVNFSNEAVSDAVQLNQTSLLSSSDTDVGDK